MALFLGRLSLDTRSRDLEELFNKYGRVTRLDIKRGTNTGFGFVEYEDGRDAEEAARKLNGHVVNGNPMVVEFAKNSTRRAGENECFKCGKDGHWARDCRGGGGEGGRGGGGGGNGGGRADRDRRRSRSPRGGRRERSHSRSRSPPRRDFRERERYDRRSSPQRGDDRDSRRDRGADDRRGGEARQGRGEDRGAGGRDRRDEPRRGGEGNGSGDRRAGGNRDRSPPPASGDRRSSVSPANRRRDSNAEKRSISPEAR